MTSEFLKGAAGAEETARRHGCRIAILKDGSPSCARTTRYDGTFTGTKTAGIGVTTEFLTRSGVRVFTEKELPEAADWLATIERTT